MYPEKIDISRLDFPSSEIEDFIKKAEAALMCEQAGLGFRGDHNRLLKVLIMETDKFLEWLWKAAGQPRSWTPEWRVVAAHDSNPILMPERSPLVTQWSEDGPEMQKQYEFYRSFLGKHGGKVDLQYRICGSPVAVEHDPA